MRFSVPGRAPASADNARTRPSGDHLWLASLIAAGGLTSAAVSDLSGSGGCLKTSKEEAPARRLSVEALAGDAAPAGLLHALAQRMKHRFNVAIVFVGYITLITAESRDLPLHEQIAETNRFQRAQAREPDMPVVVAGKIAFIPEYTKFANFSRGTESG